MSTRNDPCMHGCGSAGHMACRLFTGMHDCMEEMCRTESCQHGSTVLACFCPGTAGHMPAWISCLQDCSVPFHASTVSVLVLSAPMPAGVLSKTLRVLRLPAKLCATPPQPPSALAAAWASATAVGCSQAQSQVRASKTACATAWALA